MAEIILEGADEELSQVVRELSTSLERHGVPLEEMRGRRLPGECSEVQLHLVSDSWHEKERALDGVLEARLRLLREGISFNYCFGGGWPPLDG